MQTSSRNAAAVSKTHLVELRDLVLNFGAKRVLDEVSLTVDPQERLVIIGQSGAGKTTILRLILGILRPDHGAVYFKKYQVSQLSDRELEPIPAHGSGLSGRCVTELVERARESGLATPGID